MNVWRSNRFQIHQRLRDEGYNVGEYALRQCVSDQKLPAVYIGKRALVCYENVLLLLRGGTLNAKTVLPQ